MPERLVAIHQPNFFPWLGYFDKIRRVDRFILLDDVQFPKTGGSWTNRVKILQVGEGRWLTAPIDRSYSGVRRIDEMHFAPGDPWRDKAINSLGTAYAKAPCFREAMDLLRPLIANVNDNVAEYNIHAISALVQALGMDWKILSRSSDAEVDTTSTARLVDLVKAAGGTHYLCGAGAEGYQEDQLFEHENISLIYQGFKPAPYPQLGTTDFVAGLSVIDALMHVGVQGTRNLFPCSNPSFP